MSIKKILTAMWELPQNALGFIVKLVCKPTYIAEFGDAKVYHWGSKRGSMSLGKYIFVQDPADIETIKHEYGHTVQSKYLGWLYLLVIGLPSFIWCNCFEGYRKKTGLSYYWLYTEAWADKLGGVERSEK